MSNLKELKSRINSVISTKKITRIMKMVAAANLKKAQKKAFDSRPCSFESKNLINKIISTIPKREWPELLKGNIKSENHLLFIISSNRGLCGGYNSSIVKLAKRYLQNIEKSEAKIVCIGKKARDLLKSEFSSCIIKYVEKINTNYKSTFELMSEVISENKFRSIQIFFTKFEGSTSQVPTKEQVIPFENIEIKPYECKYEPKQVDVLENLVKKNLSIQLYKAIVESQASEYISRMIAMDNATRNADEMIKDLTLVYNRSRQANITKELIEIVSGAEAI